MTTDAAAAETQSQPTPAPPAAAPTSSSTQVKVFVSGCYDIIHGGHVEFWSQARALGTHLTVSFAGDDVLAAHKSNRRSSIPTEHKKQLIGSMRMVDEVVVGEGHEPGLDFKDHFLRIKPQLLVVTEDDKYGEVKRQLCAQVGAKYVILPKTLDYTPTSTTQILANIRAPSTCPLRVDFGGGWLDVPKHAREGAFIVNCAISPLVSHNEWPYNAPGAGLGGSAAHALLNGRDPVQSELDLGVGWQDPAVIRETGLCVWRSGPKPVLDFKVRGDFLLGKMALAWTGSPHVTYENTDLTRNYDLVQQAGSLARQAVLPGQESIHKLAEAINTSYAMQQHEGMAALPDSGQGELAKKYCGGGWGGYALYLFETQEQRAAFLQQTEGSKAIEPYIH